MASHDAKAAWLDRQAMVDKLPPVLRQRASWLQTASREDFVMQRSQRIIFQSPTYYGSAESHMSNSPNSLTGGCIWDYIGEYDGGC